MYSTGVACPSELAFLTEALRAYCLAKGIVEGTPDYKDAGEQVFVLFSMGYRSKEEIMAALENRRWP